MRATLHSMNISKPLMALVFIFLQLEFSTTLAQPVDLSSKPLSTINSDGMPIPPNIMFVLDESGSMTWDFMPDHTRGTQFAGFSSICRNPIVEPPNSSVSRSCRQGDPPNAAYRVNTIYYNPNVVYEPPVDADGSNTTYKSYDNSSGWTWNAVRSDGFDLASATIDIGTGFPEVVYCNTATPTDFYDQSQCRANGTDYSRTGSVGYPVTTGSAATSFNRPFLRKGAPYYYEIEPQEWCTDAALRNCTSTTKTASHPFPAYARYCNSTTASNLAAGTVGWPDSVPFSPKMLAATGPNPPDDRCQAEYFRTNPSISGPKNFDKARFGRFVRVDISPSDTAQMTNFANWYAYYRTRNSVVKSALGKALAPVGDNFNIGYLTTGFVPGDPASNNKRRILPSLGFSGAHKSGWYKRLYEYPLASFLTNLAAPFTTAGRYLAGELDTHEYRNPLTNALTPLGSPTTRVCQANYAVVISDGRWKTSAGAVGYAGAGISGNEDLGVNRPYFCPDCVGTAGGPTLADATQYYYVTDMKPGLADEVPTNIKDSAKHQHVTTYTIGFGVGGTLTFQNGYETDPSSDYQKIRNGTWDWPGEGVSTSIEDKIFAIDDLWHAAVNGRGEYFAAQDAAALVAGFNKIIASATRVGDGTAAAATVANPMLSAGERSAFISQFTNQIWTGELLKVLLDKNEGTVESIAWQASKMMPDVASRKILTPDLAGGSLIEFSSTNFGLAEFDPSNLTHFSSLTAAQKSAATSARLIDFLRGDRSFEALHNDLTPPDLAGTALFRKRESVLGDIVNSEAAIGKTLAFVGANDGMLHAFDGATGTEVWAFIPTLARKEMYRLADKSYSGDHRFYVDGSPVLEEVCTADCGDILNAKKKTLLVGGFNRGGRGYYALDVSDPYSPELLWEFSAGAACVAVGAGGGQKSDCDLGYSYGNPVITKVLGDWSVLFTSGYNNGDTAVPPGSGGGYLYIVDAFSGKLKWKLATVYAGANVGQPAVPSGLGKLAVFAENYALDNTALRAYAGDLRGNLWRFNLEANPPKVVHLAYTKGASGQGDGQQPISSKPELASINGKMVVIVGTGQLLGQPDFSTVGRQAIYAVRDDLGSSSLGELASLSSLVRQTLVPYVDPANPTLTQFKTTSLLPFDWDTNLGWYLELQPGVAAPSGGKPKPSERIFTDPALNLGTIALTSFIPPEDPCGADGGGVSLHYVVDLRTGGAQATTLSGIASRPAVVRTETGKLVSLVRKTIGVTKDGAQTDVQPVKSSAKVSSGRRVNWREVPGK